MTTSPETLPHTRNRLPFPHSDSALLNNRTARRPALHTAATGRRGLLAVLREADHLLACGDSRSRTRAHQHLEELRHQAQLQSEPHVEFRVLTRLAEQFGSSRSPNTLQWLRDAGGLLPDLRVTASSREEQEEIATHSLRLGLVATRFALNGHPALHLALRFFHFAITVAERADTAAIRANAYFWLGNLLENLFLIPGRRRDLRAAWACYTMARGGGASAYLTAANDPDRRIRQRILPRLRPEMRAPMQVEVETAAAQIAQEAVARELAQPERG